MLTFDQLVRVISQPAPTVPAEATALFARMTTAPRTLRQVAIVQCIGALKTAGVWQKLDAFYIFAAADAQASLLNWVSGSYNCTNNSATFSADSGYTANGTTGWLDSGFNPTAAASPKFTQDSASFGVWATPPTTNFRAGLFDGTNGIRITPTPLSNILTTRINQASDYVAPALNTAVGGLALANRSGAAASQDYSNGELLGSSTAVSAAPVDGTIGFLREGSVGTLYAANGTGIAFGCIGGSLSATEQAALYAAVAGYLSTLITTTISANFSSTDQTYEGGYIEIQPDSYTGGVPATDGSTALWGFPFSLTSAEQIRMRSLAMPGGGKGIKFLRLPLGFAYRGFRNIDAATGLAKNIGPRFAGQNAALTAMLANVVAEGGGLMPEYWAPPVYWLINSAYAGTIGSPNQLWAGGSYPRATTLDSIRSSDPAQYAAQVAAFTDAIVNDYEYLHQNVGPVRGYGLQNEPLVGVPSYGVCKYTDALYSDVLASLQPKVAASMILASWGGAPNTPKLHLSSESDFSIGATYNAANASNVWSYTYHQITEIAKDADWIKNSLPTLRGPRKNAWTNETEYFSTVESTPEWRCANNMLRDLHNVVYGSAPMNMPIIHLCKQIGASGAESNTDGYGLFKARLPAPFSQSPATTGDSDPGIGYGEFAPVVANYNAYRMFADNLPVGAVRVGGAPTLPRSIGFAAFTFGGKLTIFVVNRNQYDRQISIPLSSSKTLVGKLYRLSDIGTDIGSTAGATLAVTMPRYSAQVWIEQ